VLLPLDPAHLQQDLEPARQERAQLESRERSMSAQLAESNEKLRSAERALVDAENDVRIRRDEWGVPHILGKTDADAAYGLGFAQSEDDFPTLRDVTLATRGVLDMSGGERARVLLARLLATRAPLLVADEPIAGLDPDAQLLTLDLLRAEAAAGAGVVVTLHDLSLAARCCDRLAVIDGGRVVSEGAPGVALSPEILARVFRLDGALVETSAGPVLAARRL